MVADDSNYSLVALDIDGTMIGDDRIVPADLFDAIARIQSFGTTVSVATGRTLTPALRISQQAGVTGPIICFQGAMTYDQATRSEIRHVRLDEKTTAAAITRLKTSVPEVMLFVDDDVWVEKRSEWANGYGARMGVAIKDVDSLLSMAHKRPTAVIGIGDPDIVGRLVEELAEQLDGSALVTHSLPMFCEVEAADAGKDRAIAHLAETLGVGRHGVIAVGDGKGDQSMIEWAGLGVAVAGGHPDAVLAADRLIAQPEEHGLANLLNELADRGRFGSADRVSDQTASRHTR